LDELKDRFTKSIAGADIVVIGSYVPDGIAVGRWATSVARNLTAFYDIDTPVTLANLAAKKCEYIARDLYPKYQLYLSFTGGPTLKYIERELGSPCAQPLYCSVDPALYYPESEPVRWDLAYLGTYAADRQPSLNKMLIEVARRQPERTFAVGGPQYPAEIRWPKNVERIEHVPASAHRSFYNSQRFTLNLTRQDMIRAGYSPSVRLFESAACGTPIMTDEWPGLDNFFTPGSEILRVRNVGDVTSYLQMPDDQRREIGERGRRRTLLFHTAAVRAEEFERYVVASFEQMSCVKKKSRSALNRSVTAALT
jgi:spore maturation protein CgeB